MAKKLKKDEDQQLTDAVRNSAQQIWQAGLGAFAKAQEEGGRVFSKLVKDGTDLQKRTRSKAGEKVSGVRETVSGLADDIGSKASGSWDKLEQVFEERVVRALSSIGVPTQKEIDALVKRVDQLSKAVAELSGKAAPKAAVKKTAAKKAAVKKPTVAKTPAAKPAAVKSVAIKAAAAKPAAKKSPARTAAKSAVKPAAKKATKPATKAAA